MYDLLVHPTTPKVMYAHGRVLFKTTNGGETWATIFDGAHLSCVAMDPRDPESLLAGKRDGSVWRSRDAGSTWSNVSANLPGFRISAVAFGDKDGLWAGTGFRDEAGNGLLYLSVNGGRTWSPVTLGQAPQSEIMSVFVDPRDRRTVYVGLRDTRNQMFNPQTGMYLARTANDGGSWTPLRLPFTDAMVNVMGCTASDATLYVGTGGELFQSDDSGRTWKKITPSGRNGDLYDIAVDPRDPNILYLPRRAYGIARSADRGRSWKPVNDGLRNTTISLIAAGAPPGNELFAAANSGEGTYRSDDGGDSWVNVTAGGISHPWADELAISPTDPKTIWEVADVGNFYVSRDRGSTWSTTVDSQTWLRVQGRHDLRSGGGPVARRYPLRGEGGVRDLPKRRRRPSLGLPP